MADLSIYLFWTGMLTASAAGLLYFAYVASAALPVRRMTAQTEAGTVTISSASGVPSAGVGRLATTFTAFTVLALGGAVATRWAAVHHPPLSNLYEATVGLAFATSTAYLFFETTNHQRRLGVVALPLIISALVVASLFPSDIVPLIPALQNGPLMAIHVSTMMSAYAVLTVSFCGAVVYLLQGGEGKRRFTALPAANAAGDLAHKAAMAGTVLSITGIALGAWWANSAWGRPWGWDPKETSALSIVLCLACYFHASAGTGSVAGAPGIRRIIPERIRRGRRPDPMWWLIAMWGLVLFTYFAVNLWISGLHSYAGV
jgi:ABC-type transport system involved in cytochrome c biogenesis permease subunit